MSPISGIGGLHYALLEQTFPSKMIAHFDINDHANTAYKHNFNQEANAVQCKRLIKIPPFC
jgi:site-specific DNA-cytosine methylase